MHPSLLIMLANLEPLHLGSLFTDAGYSHILEHVLVFLPWRDIVSSHLVGHPLFSLAITDRSQISHQTRSVSLSSPRIQLAWCYHYHALIPPNIHPQTTTTQQLKDLLEVERRLTTLDPVRSTSIPVPRYEGAQISGDWLLLTEASTRWHVGTWYSLWDLTRKNTGVQEPASSKEDGFSDFSADSEEEATEEPMLRYRITPDVDTEGMISATISADENLLIITTTELITCSHCPISADDSLGALSMKVAMGKNAMRTRYRFIVRMVGRKRRVVKVLPSGRG
jgi:hypothetical protein